MKLAGVTQAKAWFRKSRVCSSLTFALDPMFQERPKHNHDHNFQKSFVSDATPKWRLMAHQMKNLCGFSVFHCVEGACGASSGGTPKWKMGLREMNSKMVVVVVGPSLNVAGTEIFRIGPHPVSSDVKHRCQASRDLLPTPLLRPQPWTNPGRLSGPLWAGWMLFYLCFVPSTALILRPNGLAEKIIGNR